MDWIVTTARSVEEAQSRALDLLGVDISDAEIQVIEEGKTGLFGRTKTEARIRARIKPKAPPAKEERQGRNGGDRNRNRNRGGRNRNRGQQGGNQNRNQGKGGGKSGGQGGQGKGEQGKGGGRGGQNNRGQGKGGENRRDDQSDTKSGGRNQGGGQGSGGNRRNDRNSGDGRSGNTQSGSGGRRRNRSRSGGGDSEDRIEMPVDEQRQTLEEFVTGVAVAFDESATVTLVEEGTTLLAKVEGADLGRLIGPKAATLQTFEELARTSMHRAAAGRRYHRIQVDVDEYWARRREALVRFAVSVAESVVDSGESKAMEPMSAADRKTVHDAVGEVAGVETVSEGRDPRRYIVIRPLDVEDDEEE